MSHFEFLVLQVFPLISKDARRVPYQKISWSLQISITIYLSNDFPPLPLQEWHGDQWHYVVWKIISSMIHFTNLFIDQTFSFSSIIHPKNFAIRGLPIIIL